MRRYCYMFLLLIAVTACRDNSEYIRSYGQVDYLNFNEAEESYANQFRALWTALNCNYAMWDYESACGLDWDQVYDTYLPKFEELDDRDSTQTVENSEVEKLYKEVFSPLHDGHLYIQVKNLKTGDFIDIRPNYYRNESRSDYDLKIGWRSPAIYRHAQLAQDDPDCLANFMAATSFASDIIPPVCKEALQFVKQQIDSLENLPLKTDLDDFRLEKYQKAEEDFEDILELENEKRLVAVYGELRDRYEYLDARLLLPVVEPYDENLRAHSGCFADGIPYIQFNMFYWSRFMGFNLSLKPATLVDSYAMGLKKVWLSWYNTIAALKEAGQLKGIIIDLRSNGGGYNNDFRYVVGSLIKPGGMDMGYNRFKSGTGRLDYSPVLPSHFDSLCDPDVSTGEPKEDGVGLSPLDISEPIVVLTNCWSVSMAEVTTASVKALPNGYQIGTTSWGGFSSLTDNPAYYSLNYASSVGERDKTCFFAYIPTTVTTTLDHQYVDGTGLKPDIEVALDRDLLENEGRDTQLERALQYIRTGQ